VSICVKISEYSNTANTYSRATVILVSLITKRYVMEGNHQTVKIRTEHINLLRQTALQYYQHDLQNFYHVTWCSGEGVGLVINRVRLT